MKSEVAILNENEKILECYLNYMCQKVFVWCQILTYLCCPYINTIS